MASALKKIIQINVRISLGLQEDESGVAKLMQKGFANGTAQRILDADTSIGVDTLGKLAKALEVEPWQLCAPNLGRGQLPIRQSAERWPFASIERQRWMALSERHKGAAEDAALQAIVRLEGQPGKRDSKCA